MTNKQYKRLVKKYELIRQRAPKNETTDESLQGVSAEIDELAPYRQRLNNEMLGEDNDE